MYYRLKATAIVVPLVEDGLLLKTDTVSIRMEGGFAQTLQSRILPALDGQLTVSEIARRLDLPTETLLENFDQLVDSGLFERSAEAFPSAQPNPRHNLLRALGMADGEIDRRLIAARIAVFGLERPGATVAEMLLSSGFRNLTLVDSFAATPLDFLPDELVESTSREELLATRLRGRHPEAKINLSGGNKLAREATAELARGHDLLIACWDQGFSSGNHWVNRASHALGIPAVFCELGGLQVLAGPFVVPGMTACYMCSRMRAVAAAENYGEAMACEQFLDQLKSPRHDCREFLPAAVSTMASLLVAESLKFIILNQQPALLGAIAEYDPFELSLKRHVVLEQPGCPVCSQKKNYSRVNIPVWQN
ncbi:MAG TPA: TOMM precursor leader peptide-binding protein [Chthoniobacterales bacterium]|nr:TOMM precursor leader peptide-binding protein [Chthoniobacterales bacterium]